LNHANLAFACLEQASLSEVSLEGATLDIETIVEFALKLIHANISSPFGYIQKVTLEEFLSETKKTYAQIAQ